VSENVPAFLDVLSHSEGTDKGADPYRVCYAFRHSIQSLSDHPAVTGEWTGERITVGRYAGELSTAAGRYQINKPTWLRIKAKLGLTSFENDAQDSAAVELLKEYGAFDLVDGGDIKGAIAKLANVWASLPGGDSGQHEFAYKLLQASYLADGGQLA
jgi:muramidase (phage lysozyme)